MQSSETTEIILAHGHENIQATHKTTIEFTKDTHLSKEGDCIVAVAADKALADLNSDFKKNLQKPHAKLTISIEAEGITEQITAQGSPQLFLTHPSEIVVRKSDYVSSRTLAIRSDKAARDLSRALVEKLKNPRQKVTITLEVRF